MNLDPLYKLVSEQEKKIALINSQIEIQTSIVKWLIIVIVFFAIILILKKAFMKYDLKNKYMSKLNIRNRIKSLDKNERNIFTIIASLISALIIGYLLSDTAYYQTSYDFANGIRISEEDYFYFKEKGQSDVFKKVTYNYLIFFSVLVIFIGLIYIFFQKQDRTTKPGNLLEEAQRQARPLIINGYRKVGKERGCAPTSKTSDKKIIDVYTQVLNAFNSAAKIRDERIPAVKLNFIALKFFQVYEMMGEEGMNSHLEYEVEKYLEEGLRAEYNQPLELF